MTDAQMRVLVTCPPMLRMIDEFRYRFEEKGAEVTTPNVTQTLPVEELVVLVPEHEGWIIGDDPANEAVFKAGSEGRLKAAVKWGIGIDNVDFKAAKQYGIPVTNTPGMFGREVGDLAMHYITALARYAYVIDRAVREGGWSKPAGTSLAEKTVALVGYGDIGSNIAKRCLAADMKVTVYARRPRSSAELGPAQQRDWPEGVEEADFLVLACPRTEETYHMVNHDALLRMKKGVRIVNVARGELIDEAALVKALYDGRVQSAALDVYEKEPLPSDSPLRQFSNRLTYGSHNASNTQEAVRRTSHRAIDLLFNFYADATGDEQYRCSIIK